MTVDDAPPSSRYKWVFLLLVACMFGGMIWTWQQAQRSRAFLYPTGKNPGQSIPEPYQSTIDRATRFISLETGDAGWITELEEVRGRLGPFRYRDYVVNEYGMFTAYHATLASSMRLEGAARILVGWPFLSFELRGTQIEVFTNAPMRPLWAGWFANTFLYSIVMATISAWLLVMSKGCRRFVRWWRTRSVERCVKCGYDLRFCAKSGCPECGYGRPLDSESLFESDFKWGPEPFEE